MDLFDIVVARKLSGGGGGGDLSTATVTFTNNTQNSFPIAYSFIFESDELTGIVNGVGIIDSDVLTVPLYKGFAGWSIMDDVSQFSINTSGDVIHDEDVDAFIITGDCTITIS